MAARIRLHHRQYPAAVHQVDRSEHPADLTDAGAHALNRPFEVLVPRDTEEQALHTLRNRCQRNRHAGDDPEGALREHAVQKRSDTPFEALIDIVAAKLGQRRTIDASVRQHRFERHHR